jgi:hypothetical protein
MSDMHKDLDEKMAAWSTLFVMKIAAYYHGGIPAEVSSDLINGLLDVASRIYAAALRDDQLDAAMDHLRDTMANNIRAHRENPSGKWAKLKVWP